MAAVRALAGRLLRAPAPPVWIPASALAVPLGNTLRVVKLCHARRVLRVQSTLIRTLLQLALGVALASMPRPAAPPVPHALQERLISTPTRQQRARTAARALTRPSRRHRAIRVQEGARTPIPLRQRSAPSANRAIFLPRKPSSAPHVPRGTSTLMKIRQLRAIRTTPTCAPPVHTPQQDLQNAHRACLVRLTWTQTHLHHAFCAHQGM